MKRRKKAANRRRPRHQQKRRPVPLPPVRLPNEYDDAVIEQLRSAPLGTLKLDRFAEFLKGKPASDGAIAVLRSAPLKVYEQAAWFRAEARTSNEKIKSAEAGLDSLWKAASHLEQVQPKHRRGLAAAFAPPSDDPKGRD